MFNRKKREYITFDEMNERLENVKSLGVKNAYRETSGRIGISIQLLFVP